MLCSVFSDVKGELPSESCFLTLFLTWSMTYVCLNISSQPTSQALSGYEEILPGIITSANKHRVYIGITHKDHHILRTRDADVAARTDLYTFVFSSTHGRSI